LSPPSPDPPPAGTGRSRFPLTVGALVVRGASQARAAGVTLAVLVAAVAVSGATADGGSTASSDVWKPRPGTTWQWQIMGDVDETVDAQMFDVDLFDARPGEVNAGVIERLHARGRVVICYVDTGAWESYRPDARRFPRAVLGRSTGWPGERWLDIRKRSWPKFAHLIWRRLDLARALGCDGVEPDQNNPIGNRPGFPITLADQKAWYLEVARQAHRRGLSVGMKNGVETIDTQTIAAFDWALNEECFRYQECSLPARFVTAGKAVFHVEYELRPTAFCATARQLGFSSMRKRLALDAWRRVCW
jgi:hypothetical protein